eukprot:gnl/Dysnectes_brevis/1873_a2152_1880.p1 GENE.gnl/Dysnectes_brevis/1873_a2152_1880~~gnl/Dysnectes_brevis/1873_a2152_1880.p1  ORF type:complete len:211 (+),score=38.63 gnl/Dysnectes_brevis/1873_a2152_1880:232-864(+)
MPLSVRHKISKKDIPNLLSLSRIPLLFTTSLCYFIQFKNHKTCGFILFLLASFTDYLDGASARSLKAVSTFGVMFDSLADKVLNIGIFITFIAFGYYPAWFVFPILVILSREFVITGLRMIASSEKKDVSAKMAGKIKTAVQMISVCMTCLSHSIEELSPTSLSAIDITDRIGKGLFLLGSLLTLTSGYSYIRAYGHLMLASSHTAPKQE